MLILIIFIMPIIFYFGILKGFHRCFELNCLLEITSVFSTLIFVILLGFALCVPMQVEIIKANYHAVKTTIEQARLNKNISKFERIVATDRIIDINRTIERHKTFYDSIWVGIWYSEEIGNLDYVDSQK